MRRVVHHGDVQIVGAKVVPGDDVEHPGPRRRVVRHSTVGEDPAPKRVRVDGVQGNEHDVEAAGGRESNRRRWGKVAHDVDGLGQGVLLGIVARAVEAEERDASWPHIVVPVHGDHGFAQPGAMDDACEVPEPCVHVRPTG